MLFNPEDSIDFNGSTGPFIQYTYARINSILRKNTANIKIDLSIKISNKEKELIKLISEFPKLIQESANSYSPALVANYIYNLVKEYNSYYQSTSVLGADSDALIAFRVALSKKISEVIKTGMSLLGIQVPERM
jgi:arginyl-tRNA synthetase